MNPDYDPMATAEIIDISGRNRFIKKAHLHFKI